MSIVKRLGMGSTFFGFLLLVSIAGIIWYTFVYAIHEQDFQLNLIPCYQDTGCIGGWGEYGRLWGLLNPFFYTQPFYAFNLLVVQIAAVLPQLWLVKKGKLSRNLVYFNIFTSMLFRAGYSQQDVTTTMFAPLASYNPIFSLLFIFQKFGIGWTWNLSDGHWAYMANLTSFEPFVWLYFLLMLWFFLPIVVWIKNTFFKNRFNWKFPTILKLETKATDIRTQLVEFITAAWLSAVIFLAINSVVSGGYLLQICHPWQLNQLQFYNQCTTWITLPETGGMNLQVLVALLSISIGLGVLDVILRLRRRKK